MNSHRASSGGSNGQYNRVCQYFLQNRCKFGVNCKFIHNVPRDDRTCGICFDVVLNKIKHEQVFGILPNCNHCFCFTCILRWRQSKEFDFEVSKACPECRVASEFVYPSKSWVDNKEDKDKFISERKRVMAGKNCKYFNRGSGICPFGNVCLYMHCLPDGTKVDVGPPVQRNRRRRYIADIPDFYFFVTSDDFLEDDHFRSDLNMSYSSDDDDSFYGVMYDIS